MTKFYKSLTAVAVLFSALSVNAKPFVVAGDLLTSDTQGAVYEISSDGSKSLLTNPAYSTSYAASGGGCYNNGKYYMSKIWMNGYSSQTYTFDTGEVPWKSESSDGSGASTVLSTDYSYDTQADVIYAFIKYSGTNYKIGKITPGSSWSTRYVQVQVGPDMKDVTIDCSDPLNKWHGIAFDADNQLWVITFGGILNKVNKDTGAMTVVGDTGILPSVNGSAAFDFKTGKLYWAVKNSDGSAVYEVDTTSATATKIMDVPDNTQLMGIFIPEAAAEDGAPAAPANVHYDFAEGALDGSVVFDIPATTFDDQPAEGSVTYCVTVADNDPITGSAEFGQQNVSVPFSVTASGMVTTSVYLENETGKSPVVKYEGYIGYGTPVAPANVSLNYEDGKMSLSWDTVTEVSDGLGFLGNVKYNVNRICNGASEEVASGITETEFEEEIAEPEDGLMTYSYSVTATNEEFTSTAAASSSLTLGSIQLPYVNDFSTEADFNSMTNINCNPASKGWTWSKSSGYVTIGYDRDYTKDDWLISPPFKIHKGYEYTVSVDAKSQSASYPEKVGISWGFEPTEEGMSEVLVPGDENVPNTFTTYSGKFTAETTGIAYAGIHACSDKDMSTLQVDNFSITFDIPAGIDNACDSSMSIRVAGNVIIANGNGHVNISAIDGTTVADTETNGELSVSVNPGIYVINANGTSSKILVR